MANRNVALVLFGGSGTRFGAKVPKQFINIGGKPMMAETLLRLSQIQEIDEIYVVAKPDTGEQTAEVIDQYRIKKIRAIIPGGDSREESVYLGLSYLQKIALKTHDIVLIHDGDRPNIDEKVVLENLAAAKETGAAVTAIPATDSIIASASGTEVDGYRKRSAIYFAQTPQTFRFGIVWHSFQWAAKHHCLKKYTDDASLVKSRGHKVKIILGSKANVKITTKIDLATYLEGRMQK